MANIIANGIDCYSPITALHVVTLAQDNVTAACRYLGARTMGWAKGLTPAEVEVLHAHGINIVLNWEGNPTYASYFAYAQGLRDGRNAAAECKWLRVPHGIAVYFSVDYDAQDADLTNVAEYFRGVRVGLGAAYKMGVYGNKRVVDYVDADYYWQTLAWSGGQVSERMHMYQSECNVQRYDMNVDINDVYAIPGWWDARVLPTLRQSATGRMVRYLQQRLNANGAHPQLSIDGVFGPDTEYAVKQFQSAHGLVVDGIVGDISWAALE